MLRRFLQTLLVLASLGFLSATVSAQLHKDERLGYQIRTPKKWTQIPIRTGEQWVCARFNSHKENSWTDDTTGYTRSHTPSLRVVAFVDKFINRGKQGPEKGEEDEAAEDGGDGGDESSSGVLFLTKIYQDYGEFLKENLRGGYFVSKESEDMHGKLKVRKLEMRAEEAGKNGHRLILTWIYPTEIGKIAVEFELLESVYKKNKASIDRTFRSFTIIPRTKELTASNSFGDYISLFDLNAMTPEERGQRKREIRDKAWEKIKEDSIDGWTAMEFDDIRVITRHDKKHAQAVVNHVNAVSKWLEVSFPSVGPEEYVRQPFIRICKDWKEEQAFRQGSGFDLMGTEMVTHKDDGGATGYEWRWVHEQIKYNWFSERDRTLSGAMPAWLNIGIDAVIGPAIVKGNKLKFNQNWWERGFRDGEDEWGLEQVMTMPKKSLERASGETVSRGLVQSTALLRFLLSGTGSKGKYKGFMGRYMANTAQVIHEYVKKDNAKGARGNLAPKTEAEEAARLKSRNSALAERETAILQEAYARTVANMKPSTLTALKRAYLKSIK